MADEHWQLLLQASITSVSKRKIILYFCAGLREIWDWVYDPNSREAVNVAERLADGIASVEECRIASYSAEPATWGFGKFPNLAQYCTGYTAIPWDVENNLDSAKCHFQYLIDMGLISDGVLQESRHIGNTEILERLRSIAVIAEGVLLGSPGNRLPSMLNSIPNWPGTWLIHEIYGNETPLKPINPDWLVWDAGTVRSIAEGIYEERAFDRLPILADALEEAGCEDEAILGHLRGPGEHYLGCWALDWVLGKS